MCYKEKPTKKLYYTIAEVAKIFHCATSKIRFYESKFKIRVRRNRSGIRLYTNKEIAQLEQYLYLINVVKLTIPGAMQWVEAGLPIPVIPIWAIANANLKTA